MDTLITRLAQMTTNLEETQKQKKALEKFGLEGKARVDALEQANQKLDEALGEAN